ncbi:MAG TPA: SRPBCC family protein [Acidimicrobiales bacterium]|nr:SRPBCC family protein [Acidimicrobiales bacterium]
MDFAKAIDTTHRSVVASSREGQPIHAVVLERTYEGSIEDVWDALTQPERIPRWFLPVSGDLRVGGRYQLEGNAGGTITACEPPTHLAVTWEFGEQLSWVDARLTRDGDRTVLRLEHTVPVDDHWREFGAGAVGIGWDLTLLALAEHLVTSEQVVPDFANPDVPVFMSAASNDWCRASIAAGTPRDDAEAAAAHTTAAYTGG